MPVDEDASTGPIHVHDAGRACECPVCLAGGAIPLWRGTPRINGKYLLAAAPLYWDFGRMDHKSSILPVYQMQNMNIDVKRQEKNRFNWAKGRG